MFNRKSDNHNTMTSDYLVEDTKELWNQETVQGKNIAKAARYALKHPNSPIKNVISGTNTKAKLLGIDSIDNFSVSIKEIIKPAKKGETIGNCVFCKKPLSAGAVRCTINCNGQNIHTSENGELVSRDKCLENLLYLAVASKKTTFDPRNLERDRKQYSRERIDKATLPLDTLSRKVVNALKANMGELQQYGISLDTEIQASIADEIQRQILGGDITGLLRRADIAQFKDTIQWALAHQEAMYDQDAINAAMIIQHAPELLDDEETRTTVFTNLFLYEAQERKLKSSGQLAGIKDDLLYLVECGELSLKTRLPRITFFKGAQWQNKTLDDILGQPTDSITKAEAIAVRLSVPRLREKRKEHNRELMDSYCDHRTWNGMITALYNKFKQERETYRKAHENEEKSPETSWKKPTYLALKRFFELFELSNQLRPTSFRDVALNYIYMPNAKAEIEQLYVEAKKLEAGLNPRENYVSLNGLQTTAEILMNAAIEEQPPQHTKSKLRESKLNIRQIRELAANIRTDIIKEKYMKTLQKAESLAEQYTESPETLENLSYLAEMYTSIFAKRMDNTSAQTGKFGKSPEFNLKNYQGKSYFTQEQQQAIKNAKERAQQALPKGFTRPSEAEQAYNDVKELASTYNLYTSHLSAGIDFHKMTVEQNTYPDYAIENANYPNKPLEVTVELATQVLTLTKPEAAAYNKKHYNRIPTDIKDILASPKTRVTQELANKIKEQYEGYIKHENKA